MFRKFDKPRYSWLSIHHAASSGLVASPTVWRRKNGGCAAACLYTWHIGDIVRCRLSWVAGLRPNKILSWVSTLVRWPDPSNSAHPTPVTCAHQWGVVVCCPPVKYKKESKEQKRLLSLKTVAHQKDSLRGYLGTRNMPQMKFGIWNIWAWKREHRTQSLYEIGNMGPRKVPNFGIWEEGKHENWEHGIRSFWNLN